MCRGYILAAYFAIRLIFFQFYFFGPVSEALHVGRGELSLAATLTALATGFMGPAAVKALARYPIRNILAFSSRVPER